ncbi:lysophospholipase [Ornithinibacillus sp. BX22]|uniref:Lysophospholipase n=2 Tax=Ornithinibacillus TaxID=484508 RepID=A0A923L792_9BACI|nr:MULTISPECIES: alpha/beta hydrolase [Ornithinibacillus]MBC5637827.1 lysophospholipase [Ornithinibacillus hominis]MBS3681811.1 lysophospholipase [Ornithinibacillus massiliensis]
MKTTFWMKTDDNVELYVEKWHTPDRQPKAIVQIAHGMVEHIQRYHDFARYLLEQDIFVYGNDHRGHGKTGQRQGLMGYFAEADGFTKTTDDLFTITKKIQEEYPNVPIFLLGHSMGSFLARNYIQMHSDILQGVILSGTGFYPSLTTSLGKALSARLNPVEKSPLMNKLAFGAFNRKIHNPKSPFDWISRDPDVVKAYMQDRFAGYIPTARFFFDLMTGLQFIHNPKRNANIRKNLPMLFISGEADPVGNYGKGIWKTVSLYTQLGLDNVTTTLFEGARHEVLNEINKEEVYNIIRQWLLQNMTTYPPKTLSI